MIYSKFTKIKAIKIATSNDREVKRMKKLKNNVVALVPMKREHIDGIFEAAQDSRIWEHMSVDLTTKENVIRYVEDALNKQANGTDFALLLSIS